MTQDFSEDLAELEAAVKRSQEGHYVLKLYVSGSSPRSSRAVANISTICEQYLPGRYQLDVIDLYQQPELAQQSQLIAAPTLVKEQPEPIRKLVGDMSNEDRVLFSLNIEKKISME